MKIKKSLEPARSHAANASDNHRERSEGTPSPTTCAWCGSNLSSVESGRTVCLNCLLRAALGDEDVEISDAQRSFDQYKLIVDSDGAPVELGHGAMGVTYKALDTNLRCEVALKVIHPRFLAEQSSRARFLSEARAAAQLRHRNIASVFHLGSRDGEYFYAMELVEGETIEERVRRDGPIECATALDIALQITRALIATGNRQFVHRDIKPSNVMLCTEADGAIVAKLIDFGLVRSAVTSHAQTDASPARTFIGTPHFASPEQFAGQSTDARSDIYSLGVTLWFMLTGKLPFTGTRDEIRQQQLSRHLPLGQLKGVRRAIFDLIKRMLELDPAKRPQSSVELKEQLNRCISSIETAKQKQRNLLAYSSLAAAAIVVIALAVTYSRHRRPFPSASGEGVPEKSIAVLPFENLSRNPDNQFFTDGVQDEILSDLSKVADLRVISRTSVMQYEAGGHRNLREVAQQLGVAHVVEGSVQRAANKVRVIAQLIDARNDVHLWAQTYDRDLADVFAIQSEIAKSIADQLQAKLSLGEKSAIEQRPTTDVAAFELYSRAKDLILNVGFSAVRVQNVRSGIDLLNQALARDPSFLAAQCQLALAHDTLYAGGFDHTPERRALAEAAVEAAFRLHPDSGEAHLARAEHLYYAYRDYDGALAELEIARRTLPNDPQIFELTGYITRRRGQHEEGVRNLQRAVELDPRNFFTLEQLALSYKILRRYAEVVATEDRALSIKPDDPETRAARALALFEWKADTRPLHQTIDEIRIKNPAAIKNVADVWFICAWAEHDGVAAEAALTALGDGKLFSENATNFSADFGHGLLARMMKDESKARSAFAAIHPEQEKIVQAQPDYGPAVCILALIDAGLGRKEEALREIRRAVELVPVEKDAFNGADMIQYSAVVAAWVGEKDLAFQNLAKAAQLPGFLSYGRLKLLPWWDPLRGDPRFEKLVEEAKQPIALK